MKHYKATFIIANQVVGERTFQAVNLNQAKEKSIFMNKTDLTYDQVIVESLNLRSHADTK